MATFSGTSGNDLIRTAAAGGSNNGLPNASASGNDVIFAGDGADTIDPGFGFNILFGQQGDDHITLPGGGYAFGDVGNDSISLLAGGRGDGEGGNDTLTAATTSVYVELIGGTGNDSLVAGNGGSLLTGGSGLDTLIGGNAQDEMHGGFQQDSLDGAGGDDFLFGNTNNDTITGGAGNDLLDGSDGSDLLLADLGNDGLIGGNGSDTIMGGRGFDRMDGGSDSDTLNYSGSGAIRVVLTVAQSRVVKNFATGIETDSFQNFENFVGTAGHDRFTGWGQDETFTGGAGNDTIDGGDGFDTARYDVAGVGNVNANLLTGIVQDGLGGTDRLRKASATNNFVEMIVTGGGADTLIGDSDGNFLRGGAGADSIDGGGGGDHVDYSGDADANADGFGVIANLGTAALIVGAWGSEGAVTVQGGNARDASGATDMLASIESFRGTAFNDRVVGSGDADNFFRGVQGADTIDGGFGYDWASHRSDSDFNGDGFGVVVNLSGSSVAVGSWGSEGAFTLAGGRARDGWGNIDSLTDVEGAIGTFQHDLLVGRDRKVDFHFGALSFSGEDRSYLRGLMGADTLRGIEPDDSVQADYRDDIAGVVVRLDLGTAEDGWGFIDVLQGIAGASGSMMDDMLVASATGSRLRGRAGDDTLQGGAGFDSAAFVTGTTGVHAVLDNGGPGFAQDGEGGVDVLLDIEGLISGGMADTLVGNDEDNLFFGGRGADTIVGGLGEDVITFYSPWRSVEAVNVTGVFVNLGTGIARDGDGSSALGSIDRFTGIEHAVGSHLADTLTGGAGANSLMGADGNDSITGLAGNDVLEGGIGADTLGGGADLDTASYSSSAAAVLINLALGLQAGGGDGAGDLLVQIENAAGSAFNDTLLGNGGANAIAGNAGNDSIAAGAGDDTLTGGAGNDSLNGGAGADVFRFNAPNEGRDGIFDFVKGTDLVHVVGASFAGLPAGALNPGRFVLGAPADANDFFVFNAATRILSFDADGNGAGAAVQIAVFTINNLAASDIVVV